MSEKKSDNYSETYSIASTMASTKASIKSKLNFLKKKGDGKDDGVTNEPTTKKENGPSVNYPATAAFTSLR